jgi:serine/threonine protein kinase
MALACLLLSATGLVQTDATALAQQLRNFSALKQLDVSSNPELQLLPFGLLRIVAGLESFKCDDCGLQLPAQNFFATPEENPGRIQQFLAGHCSDNDMSSSHPIDIEATADALKYAFDVPDACFVADAIEYIKIFWKRKQDCAPLIVQQLFLSLVSHKMSDSAPTLSLVEAFLDDNSAADILKWKDHASRCAEAISMPKCKRMMLNRALFLGLYEVPVGLQHEYQSSTCTVYLVDRVEDGTRFRVALKFMKNQDEFRREITSRQKMLLHSSCGTQEQLTCSSVGRHKLFSHSSSQPTASQDCIIEAIESYDFSHSLFRSSMCKRPDLVDYDTPCLLVMPAADRNLRAIMDSERITKSSVIKELFHRILHCVNFMHNRGFVHGDIKPRNILRSRGVLRLIDFDASAVIGKQYAWAKHSSAYMPPEALRVLQSIFCSDFAVHEVCDGAEHMVRFTVALPADVAAGCAFIISVSPVNVSAMSKLTLDDEVDLCDCTTINDSVITVTTKHTVSAGDHRFNFSAKFDGSPPVASCMSVAVQLDVSVLLQAQDMDKISLAKCTVFIKSPPKHAASNQMPHQAASQHSLRAAQQLRTHPEVLSHLLQPDPSSSAASSPPYPPFLTESIIESISASIPVLHRCSHSAAGAEATALTHNEYVRCATSVQCILRSMQHAWVSLMQPTAAVDFTASHLPRPNSPPIPSLVPETGSECRPLVPSEPFAFTAAECCVSLECNAGITAIDAARACCCSSLSPTLTIKCEESVAAACTGLCGLAHVSHDIWALGIILYRMSARRSLWNEDDDDNIKDDSGHLLELARWSDDLKQQRLQNIDDTATRLLVSRLLEKQPWNRPTCIDKVLSMPFNEFDVIKLKLQRMVPHDASASSNLVGSIKDLRTGKFSDAAYGLGHYLRVAADWDESAACRLAGMREEVERLKDCPGCAHVQADVLLLLQRGEAHTTLQLALALAELKNHREYGTQHSAAAVAAAAGIVEAYRLEIRGAGGWHYGLPNTISWPVEFINFGFKTFKQPMCQACRDYCLDFSSIAFDLHYIVEEAAVEKIFWNGTRDSGRAGLRLEDFMAQPQARDLLKEELIALRFYTSHSFDSINEALRDQSRTAAHPLPGMVTNIQRGLKKLRARDSDRACSKQTMVLWRGMSGMQLPAAFNEEGGTELAPMSTTSDLSVAIGYAVKQDTRAALLFRIVTRNNLERGADVQWLSMFPGESETLFPPLTFLQRTRIEPQTVAHNGVMVTVVELSTSLA